MPTNDVANIVNMLRDHIGLMNDDAYAASIGGCVVDRGRGYCVIKIEENLYHVDMFDGTVSVRR